MKLSGTFVLFSTIWDIWIYQNNYINNNNPLSYEL